MVQDAERGSPDSEELLDRTRDTADMLIKRSWPAGGCFPGADLAGHQFDPFPRRRFIDARRKLGRSARTTSNGG